MRSALLSRSKHRWAPALTLGVGLIVASCTGSIGGEGESATGGAVVPPGQVELAPSSHLVRLSGLQWRNAARDALLLDETVVADLPLSESSFDQFDTQAGNYTVSATTWDELRVGSEKLADRVVGDTTRLAKLAGDASKPAKDRALVVLRAVGRRAYRRPLKAEEEASLLKIYDATQAALASGEDGFIGGIRECLAALFQMPEFIYRSEFGASDSGQVSLKGHELAAKLSFALWNSGPSDELLDAVDKGKLDSAAGYDEWVDKMLRDPKASEVLVRFHGLMLGTGKLKGMQRDASKFPKAYNGLGDDMAEELTRFVKYVAVDEQEGGSWKTLLTSNTGFVNQKLAGLYDVPATPEMADPSKWVKVALPSATRSGLVTRAGIASLLSNGTTPSSIHRGKFVADHIACIAVVTAPKQIVVDFDAKAEKTNRKRVEAVTKGCGAGCHGNGRDEVGIMGPLGFAFENYDASGAFRERDNGEPVDAAATMPAFGAFANGIELMAKLAEAKDTHGCYTKQWASYLLGRVPGPSEIQALASTAEKSLAGAKVREVVSAIVRSELFKMRKN